MPDPIKHVVLLMLENHSFDQMLGCFRGLYKDVDGVDPDHPNQNTDKDGNVFKQVETDEVQTSWDPRHEQENVLRQLSNGNSGFVYDFSSVSTVLRLLASSPTAQF
jgi:Phospholipase C